MPTAKRSYDRPELDDRTRDMPAAALYCRSFGHNPVMKPVSRVQARQAADEGCKELVFVCSNGCGRTRTVVLRLVDGGVVSDTSYYADRAYHVPPGTGRMHRADARLAWLVQEEPQVYRTRKVTTRS